MNRISEKIPDAKSAIEHYEAWAAKGDYDPAAKQHGWLSPDVLFGLIFEYVKQGQKLLDVGCGTGLSSEYFSKVFTIVFTQDISEVWCGLSIIAGRCF